MSAPTPYRNVPGNGEEAFNFYKGVFGTDFVEPPHRMGDMPADPNGPVLSEAEKSMIMHIELPILGGHLLMGTDMIESMGHELKIGNNTTINLEPDTREETERLYAALSEGATDNSGLNEMFWGALWGSCLDRFGIRWMFNFNLTPA